MISRLVWAIRNGFSYHACISAECNGISCAAPNASCNGPVRRQFQITDQKCKNFLDMGEVMQVRLSCYLVLLSIWGHEGVAVLLPGIAINLRTWRCGCLVTWFCYQLIAKPGNKTATLSWPHPYVHWQDFICILQSRLIFSLVSTEVCFVKVKFSMITTYCIWNISELCKCKWNWILLKWFDMMDLK